VKLSSATIQLFRNFVDPQRIAVEPDTTCLVGKNESGKMTILKALHRLNPANGTDLEFDLTTDYPRWRLSRDRRQDDEIGATLPVEVEFALEADDVAALEGVLPAPVPRGATCVAGRSYDNELYLHLTADLTSVVRAAGETAELTPADLELVLAADSLDAAKAEARAMAKTLKEDPDAAARAKTLTGFASALTKAEYLVDNEIELDEAAFDALAARLPRFFYFSSYQRLPGQADLTALAAKLRDGGELSPEDETVVALLAHAGESPEDFLDEDYDSRKAELQAASSDLTRQAFKYWRQNTDLAVVFDTDNVRFETAPGGGVITHRLLKIEVRDARHGDVETNFATRSSGFQWFFSFFAAFSAYQESAEPLVVLLDEPGTSLHGDAQQDFIRFIAEELGASKQTIYTTHSQHMIDTSQYEKLRAVDDRATRDDPNQGVFVSPVGLSVDRDTVLPIESALGASVSQHLFIGAGQHLVVEGGSDFIYLQRFTEFLIGKGEDSGLDPRLAVIPVGGVDNMPAFVALFGQRLTVSALVDGARSERTLRRIESAADANGISRDAIVLCADADEHLPRTADIEDLFEVSDYLRLYNWAFEAGLTPQDLPATNEPILRRIEVVRGVFDHGQPAHALTENRSEFFGMVQPETVDRFRKLFSLLNATVSTKS
jgi:hypothetical protein